MPTHSATPRVLRSEDSMKELTEWSEEVNGHPTDFAIESESGTIAFHYDADGNLVEVYVD